LINCGRAFWQGVGLLYSLPMISPALGPEDAACDCERRGVAKHTNKAVQIATFAQFLGWIPQYCRWRESNIQETKMAMQMSKSQLIEKIAAENELAKKDVKGVLETLATIGYKELKKAGVFLVPGFAKFVVIKKPATKARAGTNPFTGEPMMFKAKPARKIVRARPVKAAKDAV
jgi:nucleoid DNA-binding protein